MIESKIKKVVTISNSYYASDKIYGIITAMALISHFEHIEAPSSKVILWILVTLTAIWLAESYEEYYKKAFLEKKEPSFVDVKRILRAEFGVMISANIIIAPFIFEILGLIDLSRAYNIAQIFGIIFLFIIGYKLANYLQKNFLYRVGYGLVSACIGMIIILLKIFVE